MIKGKLKRIREKLKTEVTIYRRAMNHPHTPRAAQWLLGVTLGYLAMPFDLIPDFIPLLGVLDDAIIIPGLVYLALKKIPDEVMTEIREQVEQES